MDELHFLRPWWLAALAPGLFLIWRLVRDGERTGGWRMLVDAQLRPYVLAAPASLSGNRWPLGLALAAWALACLALAGPTWERLPVPVFRSDEALVVALDLSRSMDAADVAPSRLARARLKLLELLELRTAGQTGLVVFTTHAYAATPLTTDTRTIAALIQALSTEIMPTQGSSVREGLAKAAELLEQAGVAAGEILLISDAEVTAADRDYAAELNDQGLTIHVLAVGTGEGAPIPEAGGGFLSDQNGNIVIPQLDAGALRRLAAAGGGRFAELAPDDGDLKSLFPARAPLPLRSGLATAGESNEQAEVWADRGAWLAAVLVPLLAIGWRRGWIALWLAVLVLPAPPAAAYEWADLWQRRDQRGYEAFAAAAPERAAELFEDPEWRAAAEYRAARYADSAASLDGIDSVTANYNRGNALAKAGQLEPAIAAYDRALALDPDHEDARHNRDLVEALRRQLRDAQQSGSPEDAGSDGEPPPGGQEPAGDETGSAAGEQQSATAGGEQAGDRQAAAAGGETEGGGNREDRASDPGSSKRSGQDSGEAGAPASPGEQLAAAAAGEPADAGADGDGRSPDEVEQWASEQAAEQWLRRVPQDPGGLLRRKFLYQYQALGIDQDGRSVAAGTEAQPW